MSIVVTDTKAERIERFDPGSKVQLVWRVLGPGSLHGPEGPEARWRDCCDDEHKVLPDGKYTWKEAEAPHPAPSELETRLEKKIEGLQQELEAVRTDLNAFKKHTELSLLIGRSDWEQKVRTWVVNGSVGSEEECSAVIVTAPAAAEAASDASEECPTVVTAPEAVVRSRPAKAARASRAAGRGRSSSGKNSLIVD